MLLEYSRPAKHGNFGDDLNEWFWDAIAPGLTDSDASTILLGMGTIFDPWFTDKLAPKAKKVLIGSGGGKDTARPDLDSTWHVYGVRGPLTAAYSALPQDKILTDPAMLLPDLPEFQHRDDRRGIGFMPHIWSLKHWDWQKTASDHGLIYIDPRAEAKETTRRLASLKGLITEAMHGAIVADAFRTPWIAVNIAPDFEGSKWSDWAGSLNLPVKFHSLRDLHAIGASSWSKRVKSASKARIQQAGFKIGKPTRPASGRWDRDEVNSRLRALLDTGPFQLSSDGSLGAATGRMRDALGQLMQDKASGVFA